MDKKDEMNQHPLQYEPTIENQVLATILKYPISINISCQILGELWVDAFASTIEKQIIADTVLRVHDQHQQPNFKTIVKKLVDTGNDYLLPLLEDIYRYAEDPAYHEQRANELLGITQKRAIIKATNEIQIKADEGIENVVDFIDFARNKMDATTNCGITGATAQDLAVKAEENYFATKHRTEEFTGIPVGMSTIDYELSGLQFGELHILAARPGQGKTALAISMIIHSLYNDIPVLFFSFEMAKEKIVARLACAIAHVSFKHFTRGTLNVATEKRVLDTLSQLRHTKLKIIDDSRTTPRQATAEVVAWTMKHGRGLVVVDYVQLQHIPNWNKGSRAEELSTISWMWKSIFKRTQTAGLVLAQINRSGAEKFPRVHEIKDCGALEQDASVIMLLMRPGERTIIEGVEMYPNEAFIDLAKNRNGDVFVTKLEFIGYCMRFKQWSKDATQHNSEENWKKEEAIITNTHTTVKYQQQIINDEDIPNVYN